MFLMMLTENDEHYLHQCIRCNKLFHKDHKQVLKCCKTQNGDGIHQQDP